MATIRTRRVEIEGHWEAIKASGSDWEVPERWQRRWRRRQTMLKDGATSNMCRESKQVETKSQLKTSRVSMYSTSTRGTAYLGQPHSEHPMSPTDYVDPLRQGGQLGTGPRRVSNTRRRTYQIGQSRQGHIGRIRPVTMQGRPRGAIREDDSTRADRGQPRAR